MENIIKEEPQTLYEQALKFREAEDYSNYHMHMLMAANLNYDHAIKELFDDYLNTRIHTKQDYNITKPFYELTKEYPYSLNYLGYLAQLDGKKQEAFDYFLQAYGDFENPVATFNLGQFVRDGICIYKDEDSAMKYFQLASDKGFGMASVALGEIYIERKEYEKAFNFYELACKQGYKKAQISIIGCLYHGNGVKQDYNKARELVEEIYRQNNDDIAAIEFLGTMYLEGNGVSPDWDRAKEFFERGVLKNSLHSINKLATMLREPGGTYEVDFGRAKELYELLIELEDKTGKKDYKISAYINLASIYGQGKGIETDYEKAIEYLDMAVNLGSCEAMHILGKLYYHGNENSSIVPLSNISVSKSYEKARKYFEMLIDKDKNEDYMVSYKYLAEIYHKGLEVDIDLEKAMGYYDLIDIYKKLGPEKVSKSHVVDFLIKVNKKELINDVYSGISSDEVEALVKCNKLEIENKELKDLIDEIPGGKEKLERMYELKEEERLERQKDKCIIC